MAICAMIIWACDWWFHGQMDDIWCRRDIGHVHSKAKYA